MNICVVSYPRSGQVWLARLLGQALECPVETRTPADIGRDIAVEGAGRPSPHRIHRSHSTPLDMVPPRPDRIVHLVRDPRDVLVSNFHYRFFQEGWETALDRLVTKGNWGEMVRPWLVSGGSVLVRYEDLHADPTGALHHLVTACGLEPNPAAIDDAVRAQEFAHKRKGIEEGTAEYGWDVSWNMRHMRKGTTGQWRDQLPPGYADTVVAAYGDLMQELGYDAD